MINYKVQYNSHHVSQISFSFTVGAKKALLATLAWVHLTWVDAPLHNPMQHLRTSAQVLLTLPSLAIGHGEIRSQAFLDWEKGEYTSACCEQNRDSPSLL